MINTYINIPINNIKCNYLRRRAILLFSPRLINVIFSFHWKNEPAPRKPVCMFYPRILRLFPFSQTTATVETNSAVVTSCEYQVFTNTPKWKKVKYDTITLTMIKESCFAQRFCFQLASTCCERPQSCLNFSVMRKFGSRTSTNTDFI